MDTYVDLKLQYERGAILELEVKKIITDHKLILFEDNGVSFRLRQHNLSNSSLLSEKLFKIIQEGEIIRAVIIDFNDEKNYFELSLRPFRNQLEGSLSFTICKNIIEERKRMRVNLPSDILEENRNQLDRIQGDLAKVDLTFLYELIQNAVDHPNPQFNDELLIKFEVYQDYLLLKHNGSIFTENNFRSLTGILLGERDTGAERIGYKGIGFKSIFRYTQEVYVRSGNFSFSFSKTRSGGNLPWEVIPIFENEIDKVEEIKNFDFFNTPVAFAFKFTNDELKKKAINYLKQLVTIPETLLFLDKLARLEVIIDGVSERITRTSDNHQGYKKILMQLNEEVAQEWLLYKNKQIITDEVILGELKDENNPSIPLKFRNFQTPQIEIAVPLSPREDLINMYAHLPLSETKYGLPYIINGDFIPNLDRTDIIKNLQYNYYLSSIAANAFIQMIKVVSKESGLERALTLLVSVDDAKNEFFKRMHESILSKKDEIKISFDSEQEYLLNQVVYDDSGIFKILPANTLKYLPKFESGHLIPEKHSSIAKSLKSKFDFREFSFDDAVYLLNDERIHNKYLCDIDKLTLFLFRLSRIDEASKWKDVFADVTVKTQDNFKYYLKDFLIISENKYLPTLAKFLKSEPSGPEWIKVLDGHSNIKKLFIDFGLNQPSLRQVLDSLLDYDWSVEDTDTNYIEDLYFIWGYLFTKRDVKNADGGKVINERFKILPIVTTNGLSQPLGSTFIGKINSDDVAYSYLHNTFGEKDLFRVELTEIAKLAEVESRVVLEFLQTIHEDIHITEKKLFRTALEKVIKLTSEELKSLDTEMIIQGLISVYKYYESHSKDDLEKLEILDFPVLCMDKSHEKISYTYFGKSYEFAFENKNLFAPQMLTEIEDIKFISDDYLKYLKISERNGFVRFLEKLYVSPGIKAIPSEKLKKGHHINIKDYDPNYAAFNNGYFNFKSTSEFLLIKDLASLSENFEALILFWSNLNTFKNIDFLINNITCNNYQKNNPLLWILNRRDLKLFPMKDGSVRDISGVYSEKLSDFLLDDKAKLHSCLDNINPKLIENLDVRTSLNHLEVIDNLRLLNNLPKEHMGFFMCEHFARKPFTKEELALIKSESYFLAKDKTIQHISKFIYIDKELEETALCINQEGYSLSNQLFTFDFNSLFKRRIESLEIPIKTKADIVILEVGNPENKISELYSVIHNFIEIESLNSLIDLETSTFTNCEKIKVGLEENESFSAEVDFFYDNENSNYYFLTYRDLADLLCEENDWGHAINKKLRRFLNSHFKSALKPNNNEKNPNNQDRYSEDELEQIKKLFSRDLNDSELMQENLFAQIKALRYFQDKSYNTKIAEENFEDTYEKKYIYPVIDSEGKAFKVMCRSARRGILFMGAYAWLNLEREGDTLLYILTGDKSADCILINSTEDLEDKFPSYYKVLRRSNTEYSSIKSLIQNEDQSDELQLMYKVKDGDFDIIFNPQRNRPGDTDGPLVNIGADI